MPIVNVEGIGRIEFPDSMTREQIDAAIKNEILPVFRQSSPDAVLALAHKPATGATAPPLSIEPNPFSKGTAKADFDYRVGDSYAYQQIDLLTRLESGRRRLVVTAVTDDEVVFNNGNFITDLLGNTLKNPRGQTFVGRQIFVGEYSLGRKWTTVYRGLRRDGKPDEWVQNFKVVARENITVPAGTFYAFKVEGDGYIRGSGSQIRITYWIAPETVRAFIVFEQVQRARKGALTENDRAELVAYRQAG